MNLAEKMGDGLVWLADHLGSLFTTAIGGFIVAIVGGTFALWRFSLALFPEKRCSRCKGNGSWGPGLLRRGCGRCGGRGRVPRVGSGRAS